MIQEAMDVQLLQKRSRIIRSVRYFFDGCGYLETDTPLLSPDLIPESCLEVFETQRIFPSGSARGQIRNAQACYLIPSPEIWMKKLIAQHRVSLYQVCKSFRNGESSGRIHSPEFTMLEYYTMDADYKDSLRITEEFFEYLLPLAIDAAAAPSLEELRPPFIRISIEEAFEKWAGFNLFEAVERGALAGEARRLGLEIGAGLGDAEIYDLIFIHAVEPCLPRERPVALIDYPAFVPCLAKKSADRKTVERWELYVRGIELANCFSEETDPQEVRRFFALESAVKERSALVPHRVDHDYWKIFLPKEVQGRQMPFPRCSGVALGLDRLIMALTGKASIDSVLPFPMS
ncbi:MAG: LysR family transcriptional regulator [Treponema sp.]|nr:LysR family transcriptional regulator [Treponema sp.]